MIVIGLDISSSSTGWAVLKNRGRFYKREGVDYGMIKPHKKLELSEKLVYFRTELIKILETTKPDIVAAEDVFFSRNPKTLKILSKFQGVAAEAVRETLGQPTNIVTVKEVRAVVGTQGKEEVFNEIVKMFKLKGWVFKKHNDITDAIAVAFYAHKKY